MDANASIRPHGDSRSAPPPCAAHHAIIFTDFFKIDTPALVMGRRLMSPPICWRLTKRMIDWLSPKGDSLAHSPYNGLALALAILPL